MKTYSQAAQDKWVLNMTNFKKDGIFVEVGAYDGLQSSNTALLEFDYNWKGVCIEAGAGYYASLEKNRPDSININIAVMPYTGTCKFSGYTVNDGGNEMQCDTLVNILDSVHTPLVIDYMSIDIEGGEEGAIESMDWDKYRVNLLTIEHNLYATGPRQKEAIYKLMTERGYVRVVEDAPCLDPAPQWHMQPFEDWYAHKDFLASKS